jgi:enoyl-CoA hydratase/carnithine racemase
MTQAEITMLNRGRTSDAASVSIARGVATITLGRPPVNAINEDWIARFDCELAELSARSDWSVLRVRSNQRVFCAGADLKEMRGRFEATDGPDRMLAFVAGVQRLFERIERLPQVTLAEISGAAMGGGLELALACDLRVAAVEARLGLPEVRLGLIPGAGGTQRLTRLCGRSIATRLILGAEVVDGARACELGLVHWAVPRDELSARTTEIAEHIASLPAAALAAAKACIRAAGEPGRGGYYDELEATRQLFENPQTRERVGAFLDGGPL